MISAVLEKDTCKACKNCCWYTDSDLWDAPGFTKDELGRARKLTANPVFESRGLFFFKMEKHQGRYVCPFLRKTGCLLESEKPFKCAIWPLYAVHIDNHVALAVSDECPSVFQLSNAELLNRLSEVIPRIAVKVRATPELIEPFRKHFRIVTMLD